MIRRKIAGYAYKPNDVVEDLYFHYPAHLPQEEVYELILLSDMIDVGNSIDDAINARDSYISKILIKAMAKSEGETSDDSEDETFIDPVYIAETISGFIENKDHQIKELEAKLANAKSALFEINAAYLKLVNESALEKETQERQKPLNSVEKPRFGFIETMRNLGINIPSSQAK